MILIIDNYDSFVHNLARYVREAGFAARIMRNDEAGATAFAALNPSGVILSPGPKRPADAGVSLDLLRRMPAATPVLGVCLGHQCLVEAFGGRTVCAEHPLHGEASLICHDGQGLFEGLPSPMAVGRYHSLVSILPASSDLVACAWSEEGELMAVRRAGAPWHGVQFHPESLLTPFGRALIENFLAAARRRSAA